MPAAPTTIPARKSAAPTPAALTIRWIISPTALLASPGASILNGQAAKLRTAALVIHIENTTARAELALDLTTGEQSSIPLADVSIERSTDDEIESIDAPGLLCLTLRHTPTTQVLYARTPLFERALSLPGGVYDPPSLHPDSPSVSSVSPQ